MSEAQERIVTEDELAALEFEPWSAEVVDRLGQQTSFEAINNPYLVTLRMAVLAVGKSKGELVTLAESLWEQPSPQSGLSTIGGDPGNMLTDLIEQMHLTSDVFKEMATVVETAEARLMVALASVEAPKPEMSTG